MRQLINTGLLLKGANLSPVADASLVVEDGLITEVRTGRVPSGFDRTEDLGDKVVMPGLIDAHVHLELTPGPDHETGRRTYEAHRRAGLLPLLALKHARMALGAGITTVRDLGADMSILAVREAINRGEPGPRLLVAGHPITTSGGHCHWIGDLRADNQDEARKATRWLVERDVDVIKVMASGGIMTPGSNPLGPQYSAAELGVVVAEAHRLGRRVVAHALNVEAIRNCVAAGVDSIDHCLWQLPDGSLAYDPELGRELIARGTQVGVTGAGMLRVLLDQGDAGVAELRRALDAHRQFFLAGGRVGLHSDAGVRLTPIDRFDLGMKVMLVGLSLSPREVLVAVTATAAEIVGLDSEIGTIEEGKRADIIALRSDPLADLDNVRSVSAVFRDGVRLVDSGRIVVSGELEAR